MSGGNLSYYLTIFDSTLKQIHFKTTIHESWRRVLESWNDEDDLI